MKADVSGLLTMQVWRPGKPDTTSTVTQSKLLTSAGSSGRVTVTPAGQLSQMGIGATERGTGFGFDWGFLAFFCGLQCPQRNALVQDIF